MAKVKKDMALLHEVIIIGAGVTGIYQLYRLLEMGVDVTVLEAGEGPGGTWYWNRYPGCRFDSESYTYGYSFSKELMDEWNWRSVSRDNQRPFAIWNMWWRNSTFVNICNLVARLKAQNLLRKAVSGT